jgi:hypothetical protein
LLLGGYANGDYNMLNSAKNIRITRISSLSAIGRRFDRDLSHPLMPRTLSSKSIPLSSSLSKHH